LGLAVLTVVVPVSAGIELFDASKFLEAGKAGGFARQEPRKEKLVA